MKSKGQVTIFIIIAIVVVASVVVIFAYKKGMFQGELPASMQAIEETLKSCLEDYAMTGADVLESQGGYIYLPDFEPGSSHMPFSSQLEFMGNAVPYWYYVSGNNIQKTQVPSKSDMENQLEQFIEEKVRNCVFDSYYEQGFEIVLDEPKVSVDIKGSSIEVDLNMNVEIRKGEDVGKVKKHSVEINSKLGNLYDSAKKIYEHEQDSLFLEEYAVDTLRLYAPVDGVEISCSPKTWIADEVFDELQEGIEANTMALKTKGKSDDYFVVDVNVDEDVRFINSRNWANNIEVDNDGAVLISNPVGNQPGLGILGFCYVPYHYVYNVGYPVLVQVSDGNTLDGTNEIFQFPMAVVIQGNNPREALKGSAVDVGIPELCKYKNNLIDVSVSNSWSDSVDAQISFDCSGTKCNIGETENGNLQAEFPQCVNGYILARAEGYQDAKYLYSEITPGSVNIILDKVHEIDVNLRLDGRDFGGTAMISFVSDGSSSSIVYPEQKTVKLSEDASGYEISVYIYGEGEIKLGDIVTEQCVDIPRSGISGILGFTKKKCFDIEIPEQIISNLLIGGGTQSHYILESELETSSVVEISATGLEKPTTIEELQNNYIVFDSKGLEVIFR